MKITDIKYKMYKWPRPKPITNGLYTYTHNLLSIVVIETDDPEITGIGISGNFWFIEFLILSIFLLSTVEILRRRSEKLRGISPR